MVLTSLVHYTTSLWHDQLLLPLVSHQLGDIIGVIS